ncbi:MAG TPA: DUF3793 family protein [Bacillota bacterium]|nr:DUF3793 family protein [Bacillota bacterium]
MEKQTDTQNLDCETFLRRRIIDLCAPVLAGLKPAALISFNQEHRHLNLVWNRNQDIFEKQILLPRLKFFELRKNPRETLVLFYHPPYLAKVLEAPPNRLFLNSFGYHSLNFYDSLTRIQSRFQSGCPHEIGIFLGIPLWDVAGFISNQGRNYLFNGYWKVYRHPDEAVQTFLLYDQARREVARMCGTRICGGRTYN